MSRIRLEAQGVSRVFETGGQRVTALEAMNLEIRAAEVVCLVGPSGCGKSTLLAMAAGLDSPTSGELAIDGQSLEGPGADRGMVFQRDCLFPWLSVRQNVHFGLELIETRRIYGIGVRQLRQYCDELLDFVGLWDFRDNYPMALSGGMRQRAAIVRALATRPALLLMDEPFGALDAQTREDMQLLLQRLCTEHGTTVLFVTHDVEEAVFLGDRVVVMGANPGRALADVSVPLPRPRDYHTKTQHDFQQIRGEVLDHLYRGRSYVAANAGTHKGKTQ